MNNHTLQVLLPARRERGFTLIELMITAAIIAILAAIAIPSYQDSIWKGKRAEGKAALLKMLQAQERYYSNKNSYVQPTGLTANERAAFPAFSADTLANSRYTLTVTTATTYAGLCSDNDLAKCVIAVATVNGPADPKCGNYLAMDSLGNKTSAVTNAICWK